MTSRQKRRILIAGIVLVLVLFGYSLFFRSYLDTDYYLELAYAYTGYDSSIINWRYPDYEIIRYKDRLAVHIIFFTTEDDTRGPIGLYIDPFEKKVIGVDPRASNSGKNELVE